MGVMKGCKQTDVGVIPEDWEVKKIGEFTNATAGGTPSTLISEYWDGEIKWMSSGELNNKIIFDVEGRITEEGLKNSSTKIIPPYCVLIGLAGQGKTRGTVAMNMVELCSNQSIAAIFPNKEVMSEYLYFNLDSRYVELRNESTGDGGRGGLNLRIIKNISIPLPPTKAEQTAIATALSDADALIQSLEKLIAKKCLIKQGAMRELLKPKEGWVVKKLGEIGECIIGLTYKPSDIAEDGYLVLRASNIGDNKLKFDDNVYVSVDVPNKLINRKGDILICVRNGSRALIGKCAYIRGAAVGQTFGAFMSVYRSEFNDFIFHAFQSNIIKKQIEENIGATINQITNKNLNSFSIPFPPRDEQRRIATILSNMDSEISALETKLAKYKQVKQGMMQNLLTGKIRLVENATVKQKVIAIDKKPSRKNHNWQINEAVVIAVLTKEFGSDEFPLGRKRYTKLSYLLHRHIERRTEGYLKKAAGPYNPDTRYKGPEKIAQTRGYIKYHSRDKYNGYVADDNIKEAVAYFNKWYGIEALRWLEQFRYKDKDQLELLTTVDMAVQDLLQNNKEVSITSVKTLIKSHNEWQTKLKRPIFSDNNISTAMRLSENLFGY